MRSSEAPQIFRQVDATPEELEAVRRRVEELKAQARAQYSAEASR